MSSPEADSGQGKVLLIGAGPGDPGLITVKGLEGLRRADVIIYDRLIPEPLLARARPGAELIYVGKASSHHTLSQEEINALLVAKAREGKLVTRLKGGDPFVFGRGGEEAEALVAAGIPFEIIPGVTSAVAVPAYAGIPVTHRGLAASFSAITGHEDPTKPSSQIDWGALAAAPGTLVFLMGVENLSSIVGELLRRGRPPQTPIAVIGQGTTPRQETVTGTLGDILVKLQAKQPAPPAVIVVGEVVTLRDRLRWFDSRPLFGRRILVTRARAQAGRLSALLAAEGAEPVELPAIEIQGPADTAALDQALADIRDFQWVIFTSVNGVAAFCRRLGQRGGDARVLAGAKLAAIGPATAEALAQRGLRADLVPADFQAQGLLASFRGQGLAGQRALLPRAEAVPPELAQGLRGLGVEVTEVVAYRTVPAPGSQEMVRELLGRGDLDAITFTSASTVAGLLSLLDGDLALLERPVIACIGPVTAQAAREAGLRAEVVAAEHTIPGLVAALGEYYREKKAGRE
ncbi:MAG: uroporphyrinogen-III C-methyltransferase [Chloroflexi bacterium]|nr:uroporphyrinogen-III C-methyltransferase [Chloroflexota bacterium]